jgi:hypothetical protein
MIGGLIGTLLAGAFLGFSGWVALQIIDAQQDITKMGISLNSMQNVLVDRIESLSIENEILKRTLLEPKRPAASNGGARTVDEPQEQSQGQNWPNMPPPEQKYSKRGIYDDIQQQVQQQEEFTK